MESRDFAENTFKFLGFDGDPFAFPTPFSILIHRSPEESEAPFSGEISIYGEIFIHSKISLCGEISLYNKISNNGENFI
jgi:hypothetical protein